MKSLLPLLILLTGCTHSFHRPPATGPIPPTEITVIDSGDAISPGPALLVSDRTQEPVIVSAATPISSGHQTLTIQSLTDSPAPQKAADSQVIYDWIQFKGESCSIAVSGSRYIASCPTRANEGDASWIYAGQKADEKLWTSSKTADQPTHTIIDMGAQKAADAAPEAHVTMHDQFNFRGEICSVVEKWDDLGHGWTVIASCPTQANDGPASEYAANPLSLVHIRLLSTDEATTKNRTPLIVERGGWRCSFPVLSESVNYEVLDVTCFKLKAK